MEKVLSIATIPIEGGGRIGVCRLPGLRGDLASDLATIAAWRASIVVSMTEHEEMDRAGSATLGDSLAKAGIDWAHLPIRDYGGPSGDSGKAWRQLAARLHTTLDEGGAVLLHCRGGHGRSGMIALRLMIERGEDADAALSRVRNARPGAVESPEQARWAKEGNEHRWPRG